MQKRKKKEIQLFWYDSYNLIAIKLVISILNHYVKVNSCWEGAKRSNPILISTILLNII